MTSKNPEAPPRGSLQPLPAAKQERSRQTLERILVAAEELLEQRDFDELTMTDLAQRAGCAVGTVYRRIPNKDSLLTCLFQRQSTNARGLTERLLQRCEGADLQTRILSVCEFVVDHCVAQRGSIRATTLHLFARPASDVTGFRRKITRSFKDIASILAEGMHDAPPDEAQAAAEFGLLAVCDVVQSRLVFGDWSGVRLSYSQKDLKQRLTRLLQSYLENHSDNLR